MAGILFKSAIKIPVVVLFGDWQPNWRRSTEIIQLAHPQKPSAGFNISYFCIFIWRKKAIGDLSVVTWNSKLC